MNFTSLHLISRTSVKNNFINFHFTSTGEKWGKPFISLHFTGRSRPYISLHFISPTFLMKSHPCNIHWKASRITEKKIFLNRATWRPWLMLAGPWLTEAVRVFCEYVGVCHVALPSYCCTFVVHSSAAAYARSACVSSAYSVSRRQKKMIQDNLRHWQRIIL